jgi:glycerol kinase
MARYVLALDQGTTGSTAFVFDEEAVPVAKAYREFPQHYPRPGWVSHKPEEIWEATLTVGREALQHAGIGAKALSGVGVTNQRETTIVWDRRSGEPVGDAVVWQCRRTAKICRNLREAGHSDLIRARTGLVIDSYFSGPKITWILDNIKGAREKADKGELAFGTVDAWLLHKLSGGKVHKTDATNASRTMLFDIHKGRWDEELAEIQNVPTSVLPEVVDSSGQIATADAEWFGAEVPITGVAGDQQAALFGQGCFKEGDVKNTYGTGCFALENTGDHAVASGHGLLTTIAWSLGGKPTYALEGSVFIAGAVVQWLRDSLGIIKKADETEGLAKSIDDNHGVYIVPAFSGLGAPYWDESARGILVGVTRGTTKAHIARAALESIAYQSNDLLQAFRLDSGKRLGSLKVDGGAAANGFLCQFQADVSALKVVRPKVIETTALGAAFFAGLGSGLWGSTKDLEHVWQEDVVFEPSMEPARRERLIKKWHRAVERAKGWEKD